MKNGVAGRDGSYDLGPVHQRKMATLIVCGLHDAGAPGTLIAVGRGRTSGIDHALCAASISSTMK